MFLKNIYVKTNKKNTTLEQVRETNLETLHSIFCWNYIFHCNYPILFGLLTPLQLNITGCNESVTTNVGFCSCIKMKPNKQFLTTVFKTVDNFRPYNLDNRTFYTNRPETWKDTQEKEASVLASETFKTSLAPHIKLSAHCVHFRVRTFTRWFQEGIA